MRSVTLRWRRQQPVVYRRHVLQPLPLSLPLDVTVPQAVGPELEATSGERPLELRPNKVLVVQTGRLHVGQVVDPQVDGQRYRLQTPLEHLYTGLNRKEGGQAVV